MSEMLNLVFILFFYFFFNPICYRKGENFLINSFHHDRDRIFFFFFFFCYVLLLKRKEFVDVFLRYIKKTQEEENKEKK